MWSHKQITSTLAAKLPDFAGDDLPLSIDFSRLDDFFKMPAFATIPTRITKPAVLRLQVVQFMDAAALKFTVQHPLCDAKGEPTAAESLAFASANGQKVCTRS